MLTDGDPLSADAKFSEEKLLKYGLLVDGAEPGW